MDHSKSPHTTSGHTFQIPLYILDDLCSKFIINIPEEERQNMIRIFFQIELAHWFYLDFYCQDNSQLKALGIKDFSAQIFQHCPTLEQHADEADKHHSSWREYKMTVPTYGAIILDTTCQYCLLVQGYWSKTNWGFPKGKVNEQEQPHDCAIREVLEETGFDVSGLIDKEEYLEYKLNEQHSRLYIIHGVSMETKFQPKTRKEIKSLEWFRIEYLPTNKKDVVCKEMYGLNPNAFFMIIPYVRPLRKWIAKKHGNTGAPQDSDHPHHKKRARRDSEKKPGRWELGPDGDPIFKDNEVKVAVSDKQRAKQQQQFADDIQKEFQSYMQVKEGGDSPVAAGDSTGGKPARRARQHGASPKSGSGGSGKKHFQILNRDGTLSGNNTPRRSLAVQFTDTTSSPLGSSDYTVDTSKFYSQAWTDFHFDVDEIMNAMNLKTTSLKK